MAVVPKFNVYDLGDEIYVELDPQDNENFQSHVVIKVQLDTTTQQYKLSKKVYQDMAITGITVKDEAIKRACCELMTIWTSN